MSNNPSGSAELSELKAALRNNLDAMGTIAARMVVLMKFRDAVLPHLSPNAVQAVLDAFDWSVEESIPISSDFAAMPAYSDAFLEEVSATRTAIRSRGGHSGL
ncbi:hypothetical protein C0Q88_19570 [Ralstonia pickettii]|uniref:Uncharacterized protein n=1 Tax=Ralstonia pickettii TaxID=329 RepID=A0A2N4TLQ9_RALPI|nr:hypothetical protein [Ralstonia pickettii]PLC40657.1 hypothetical protein C0Q88_19570 [Ralstonia pickettii]